MREKIAAKLTIDKASKMTVSGRKEIAKWLLEHSKMITREGHKYSDRFTGKYLYFEKEGGTN